MRRAKVEAYRDPAQSAYVADYVAEPTVSDFHRSDAFIRGIRGPWGSGKSVGCVMDIVMKAHQQAADRYGRRRTRWVAIRNTYGELKKTTLKTWSEWVPEHIAPVNLGEPMTSVLRLDLEDGTRVECEVIFLSCDKPSQVGKLKSWDITGAWLNEASELDKAVLDMASARVGRFPPKKDGAPFTWAGVIMDTNSMDDDHWYYGLAEGADDPDEQREIERLRESIQAVLERLGMKRELMAFFNQPPALLEAQGSYIPNPLCENVKGQPMGAAYWLQLVAGKDKEWIDIYLLNKYGKVVDGKPVYSEYDDNYHWRQGVRLEPIAGKPIRVGLDFGLSPAAVCGQLSVVGRLNVLGECVAKERSMGMRQFVNDALKPYLLERFGREDGNGEPWKYIVVGDPAGDSRSQNDAVQGFEIVREAEFDIEAAPTNNFTARRDAVAWFLNRRDGIALDQSCLMLRKGFRGGYHYRRVQVSGEARFADEAYKNKYSHPHDALQYLALPYVAVQVPGFGMSKVPDWQKRLVSVRGGMGRPWMKRGGMAR